MKKSVVLLLVILMVAPFVSAQTYSGFDRFVDNVKIFFSSGDNKVNLALDIKEKEINSAIENVKNNDEQEADKNLENAWKKLQVVQEKVSVQTAEKVKTSSQEVIGKIEKEGNLPDNFELYSLEEEKTGLTAEWVVEVNGPEGQTMTREIVGETNGEGLTQEIAGDKSDVQIKVREIETRIGEIDDEIKNWVVDNVVNVDQGGDDGLKWEVATKIVKENKDDGLTREIKTYVAGIDAGPQGITGYKGDGEDAGQHYDPSKDEKIKNEVVEGGYAEGTTADGIDAGGDGSIGAVEGTNDIAPAVDSNDGDSGESSDGDSGGDSSGITADVIKENKASDSVKDLINFFRGIFDFGNK